MSVDIHSDSLKPVALVTGQRGFTGRYVTSELERAGYTVVGLSRGTATGTDAVDIRSRQEVIDAVASITPEVVVHLAAIAFVAHGDAEDIYRSNVLGTRNLLEALAASARRPRSVLLASSANVYGNSENEVLTESVSPAPANDYAVSKLAMEYMAQLWRDRLPLIVARPFNYTGVGQSGNFLLPKIVSHFKRGERTIELGNINVARDFQDVRFVANAYRRLVELGDVDGPVNLCSGQSYSLMDVIRMMQEIAGYEIEVRVNPAFVRANEVARLTGSNERLAGLIGSLDVIPLRETLQWMYAS
ncbi:NAD-dependent epimerase/dehydratase family protein [Luteibacter anthropi]|uniref:NAD-dependent epimerase/dehydratase family protein n=1 Tax=Luteibacter anthropi TaxID=564369 RepID=UPI002032AEA2|nr:NAD-dependent epimerase/dehydratase family protein [Luteibacter anthropi]URX63035.1 NAD-dependent epimerase/dehydratase family protein [Luteibacter anthropi]